VTIQPDLRPEEQLNIDRTKWKWSSQKQYILIPFTDIRKISANRRRWISYAKVLEHDQPD